MLQESHFYVTMDAFGLKYSRIHGSVDLYILTTILHCWEKVPLVVFMFW